MTEPSDRENNVYANSYGRSQSRAMPYGLRRTTCCIIRSFEIELGNDIEGKESERCKASAIERLPVLHNSFNSI